MKRVLLLGVIITSMMFSLFADDKVVEASVEYDQESGSGVITVIYNIPEGFHQTTEFLDYFQFYLTDENSPIILGDIIYPETSEFDGYPAYFGETVLKAEFEIKETADPGTIKINITTVHQFCDDTGSCLFPVSEDHSLSLEITQKKKSNLLLFILFAFLGGLLLNVMPCVLPVLSLKAMDILQQSNQDKKQILMRSWSYSGGIIVSFLVMAAAIIILQSSGKILGWGFQFQNPGFILFLILVIYSFALSFFDVFTLYAPNAAGEASMKARNKGGLGGSFATGILAVLIATPCTAPFLGTAMGFAFSQPPIIITLMFFSAALGMGFPFLLLGLKPGIIKRLPKPGNWMETLKIVMGFLLMGTVVYLITSLYSQIGRNILNLLWYLVPLSLGWWIFGKGFRPDRKTRVKVISLTALIVLITVPGLFLLNFSKQNRDSISLEMNNEDGKKISFSEQKLKELLDNDKSVFVEFTAAWCLTCKTNRRTVLNTKEIQQLFMDYDIIYMKADLTLPDEDLTRIIRSYGRAGVPLYLYYEKGSDKPVVFPEIITRKMVRDAFIPDERQGNSFSIE